MKFAWIKAHRDSFPVTVMCRMLGVSRSGYYKFLTAKPSPRTQRSQAIRTDVRKVYEQSAGVYGSYKIARALQVNERMESACRNTVATAMREMGLKSKVSKRFKPTTTVRDPAARTAPNLLKQDFQATNPNEKWVADITYLPTESGWV